MTVVAHSRLVATGSSGPLSESIIPAVPGKFYVYMPNFTEDKPLYALLDCKANKSRTIAQAAELGREAHMLFQLNSEKLARVSSLKSAQAVGLLGRSAVAFDDVWIAPAPIAIEDFYTLTAQRDSEKLMNICKSACEAREVFTDLEAGDVVAFMTSAGKYGLFLVKGITPSSIGIEACHILLP